MKVIKHGKLIIEKPFVCDECECEFIYDSEDIRRGFAGNYVFCPECHKLHQLSDSGKGYKYEEVSSNNSR